MSNKFPITVIYKRPPSERDKPVIDNLRPGDAGRVDACLTGKFHALSREVPRRFLHSFLQFSRKTFKYLLYNACSSSCSSPMQGSYAEVVCTQRALSHSSFFNFFWFDRNLIRCDLLDVNYI